MRKTYYIKATVFDLKTEVPSGERIINFSEENGREFLNKLIFSCINNGQGLAIELDNVQPQTVERR